MEHRWGQRRETSRSVFLRTHSGLAAHGVLRNVSVSGAFILTPLPAGPLTRLQLFLAAESRDRRASPQPIECEIVRCTADGIAIEWKEFGNSIFVAMGELPDQLPGQMSGGETRSDVTSSAPTARKAR
jgi:hypothetical protein